MSMWDQIPGDLLVRILSNLSVKEVIRCTLICKSSYTFIHSNFFICACNKHALINGINPPLLLFQFVDHNTYQIKCSLRHDNPLLEEYMPLPFPFGDGDYHRFLLTSCCNGLVCFFNRSSQSTQIILRNPYLQKTLTLPPPNSTLLPSSFVCLGFVDETSDYKVFMFNFKNQPELYSLQQNSWKIIDHPLSDLTIPVATFMYPPKYPFCVKGSLYWLTTKSGKSIVGVFDLKDEIFGEISLPDDWGSVFKAQLLLLPHGGSSIAVVGHRRRDLKRIEPEASDDFTYRIQIMDVNERKWHRYSTVGSADYRVESVVGFNRKGEEILNGKYEDERRTIIRHAIDIVRNVQYMTVIDRAYGILASNYVSNLALLDKAGESSVPNYSADAKQSKDGV